MRRTHLICTVPECGQPHDAKGYCHSHYKRWRLHGDPLVVKAAPHGSGWLSRKGYRIHTVNGKKKPEHVMVAEKALGKPLPVGAIVHHVDENKGNNRNNNLVICQDNAYHKLLHRRMDAFKASGHCDWRKCPYCHEHDDPQNMRAEKSGRFVHRECSARARRNATAKRRNSNDSQIYASGS